MSVDDDDGRWVTVTLPAMEGNQVRQGAKARERRRRRRAGERKQVSSTLRLSRRDAFEVGS
eukprot:1467589-Rhodomonas_salina.1